MRLVATCPACGKGEDHVCQDELAEGGLWLVDNSAIASGRKPADAPTHDEYRKLLVARATSLVKPETVLILSQDEKLVVAESKVRLSRFPLFLGIGAAADDGWVTWLYAYTGAGGLLSLVCGRGIREVVLREGAVLKARVRDSDVVAEVVLTGDRAIEKLLPARPLVAAEVRRLKEFVDARIEARS